MCKPDRQGLEPIRHARRQRAPTPPVRLLARSISMEPGRCSLCVCGRLLLRRDVWLLNYWRALLFTLFLLCKRAHSVQLPRHSSFFVPCDQTRAFPTKLSASSSGAFPASSETGKGADGIVLQQKRQRNRLSGKRLLYLASSGAFVLGFTRLLWLGGRLHAAVLHGSMEPVAALRRLHAGENSSSLRAVRATSACCRFCSLRCAVFPLWTLADSAGLH